MIDYEQQIKNRIDAALKEAETTKSVIIGSGVLDQVGQCFTDCFGDKPLAIIADENTYQAAGAALWEKLKSQANLKLVEPFIIRDKNLYAKDVFVDLVYDYISGTDAIAVAVGSGTINDLVKLASFRCDRQYMVVATAASVDGYTAYGSSITVDDFKQTVFCPAPVAAVADLDVICNAPKDMNAAGYADLIAKIPAGADWIIADVLGMEKIDPKPWDLVQTPLKDWVANPDGIKNGEPEALAGLMEGLIMSGLAMQAAHSSRPASGADHQFSHLWDDLHHTHNGKTPWHGSKVGIGSISSEAMYSAVISLSEDDICVDIDQIQKYWPKWIDIEKRVTTLFTEEIVAKQVLEQSRAKYCSPEELVKRNLVAREKWAELKSKLSDQLLGPAAIQDMIMRAGSEFLPEQIGISLQKLQESYINAQLIRQRYTILDFILGAGLWTKAVDSLFEPQGFWYESCKVETVGSK